MFREFLKEKEIGYTYLRFFNRENKRWASAQLNILAEDEYITSVEGFWPEGVFVKTWLPWEVFVNKKREESDSRY